MGAKATVQSFLDIEYIVDMASALGDAHFACANDATIKNSSYEVRYTLPVPRATAPATKRLAYLAFVGRLVHPLFDESRSSGDPTLDDPRDVTEFDLTAYFAPERIVVVVQGGSELFSCQLLSD